MFTNWDVLLWRANMGKPGIVLNRNYFNALSELTNRTITFQASDCATDGRLLIKRCDYEGHAGTEQKIYEPCNVSVNFRLYSNLIDTAQDIHTSATPTFAGLNLNGDLIGAGGTSITMDTMTIASGSIIDSTGAITFGDENLSTAGTLTLSALTSGSVLFAGAGGLVSEDNANLFWDNTNKRLEIDGSFYQKSSAKSYFGGNVGIITTNPDAFYSAFRNLVVGTTGTGNSHGMTICSGTSAYGTISFADSTSGSGQYAGLIWYNHIKNRLEFSTNGVGWTPLVIIDKDGNLMIKNDNKSVLFGLLNDMKINYDGTDGNINTACRAASDLKITCGANKTIELQNSVYEDLQFTIHTGKVPASDAPTWENLTANTGAYAFGVNDYIDCEANEIPHYWKETTTGHLHVHFSIKSAQNTGANRYVKFTIWLAMADTDETFTETSYTTECTIPDGTAALTHFYFDVGSVNLSTYKIGAMVIPRVRRIAATGGTEYADSVYIHQIGIHLEKNTMGSRTETVK